MTEFHIGTTLTSASLNGWKKVRDISSFFPDEKNKVGITSGDAVKILENYLDENVFWEKLRTPQIRGFTRYLWPARVGFVFKNEQGVAFAIYKNLLNEFEILKHES